MTGFFLINPFQPDKSLTSLCFSDINHVRPDSDTYKMVLKGCNGLFRNTIVQSLFKKGTKEMMSFPRLVCIFADIYTNVKNNPV